MSKMNNNFLAVSKNYFGLGLKSIDILIISQIEEYERNKCKCFLTNEQFAEMFGESVSTVKRALDKLDSLKIIKRDTSFVEGFGRANRQRVLSLNKPSKWKVHNEPTIEKCEVQNEPTNTMEGSNVDDGRFKNEEWKVHNEPIKEKKKKKEKENIGADAPLTANAVPEKWIPKNDNSKEIFGSDIHTDKRIMEILAQEFGKEYYGGFKTIEDICKETWIVCCNVDTDKVAEYCTEILMKQ